jgi:hypothetical protein
VCTHLKYISKQARDSLGLFLELRSHFSWCVYVFWGGGCLACLVLLGPACLGVSCGIPILLSDAPREVSLSSCMICFLSLGPGTPTLAGGCLDFTILETPLLLPTFHKLSLPLHAPEWLL